MKILPLLEMAAVFRIFSKTKKMYHFKETQKFRQWWVWMIMIVSVLIMPGILIYNSMTGVDIHMVEVVAVCILPLLILLFFGMMALKTRIDSSGVHYEYFPLHWSERTITWDEIDSVEVRKYSPLKEYGGWGIRYSLGNGRALNVSGNMGLQLVLKNGKKVLIGTQKAEEVKQVLKALGVS